MASYVANGTTGDDVLENAWTVTDSVTSHMYAGNDYFKGWGASYLVYCGGGDDIVYSGFMGGTAYGGTGDDTLQMQSTGHLNTAYGEAGNDNFNTWFSSGGHNACYGGSGIDAFQDAQLGGTALYNGGSGFDYVEDTSSTTGITVSLLTGTGAGGNATGNQYVSIEGLRGSTHDDFLTGSDGGNVLVGMEGSDTLDGGGGADLLIGGGFGYGFFRSFTNTGVNSVANPFSYTDSGAMSSGAANDDGAADILIGGTGSDVLIGGMGADTLNGGVGIDTASYVDSSGAVTVDLLTGATAGSSAAGDIFISIENLIGSDFGDTLSGNGRANLIRGRAGEDTIKGGSGGDTVLGEDGNDTLTGGLGNDTLTGGAGNDRFVFNAGFSALNADAVTDFAAGADKIVLENAIFKALTVTGALDAANFTIGAAATAIGHHIIYDDTTGALLYDRDGSDPAAAVQFATLSPGLMSMQASDFEVI